MKMAQVKVQKDAAAAWSVVVNDVLVASYETRADAEDVAKALRKALKGYALEIRPWSANEDPIKVSR